MTAIGLAGTEVSSQQITRRLANLSRAFRAGLAALVSSEPRTCLFAASNHRPVRIDPTSLSYGRFTKPK